MTKTSAGNNIWHFHKRAAVLKIHGLTFSRPSSTSTRASSSLKPFKRMLMAQAMPTDPVPTMEILLLLTGSSEVQFFISSHLTGRHLYAGAMAQAPPRGTAAGGGLGPFPGIGNLPSQCPPSGWPAGILPVQLMATHSER